MVKQHEIQIIEINPPTPEIAKEMVRQSIPQLRRLLYGDSAFNAEVNDATDGTGSDRGNGSDIGPGGGLRGRAPADSVPR